MIEPDSTEMNHEEIHDIGQFRLKIGTEPKQGRPVPTVKIYQVTTGGIEHLLESKMCKSRLACFRFGLLRLREDYGRNWGWE